MHRLKRNCFPCKLGSFTYSYMRFLKPCCTKTHLIIAVWGSCAPAHLLVVLFFIMCDGGDCKVAIPIPTKCCIQGCKGNIPLSQLHTNIETMWKYHLTWILILVGQVGTITTLFHHFCLTQVSCSHTPPTLAATTWTSPVLCRLVLNRVPWLQATISCTVPGEAAWTGATLAGWVTAQWSIPLSTPGGPAAAPTTGPASEATAVKTDRAATMCSALPLPWKVGLVIQHACCYLCANSSSGSTFAHPLLALLPGRFYWLVQPERLTFAEAVQACLDDGAEIAKVGHIFAAWKLENYDRCDAGWLADGSVRYPIARPRNNCSPTQAAVRFVDFPDKLQKSYGVYCFKAAQ